MCVWVCTLARHWVQWWDKQGASCRVLVCVFCVHTRVCGVHHVCVYPQIREGERVALSAIGPDSVKILLKAYILARKYVTDDGLDLTRTCATA